VTTDQGSSNQTAVLLVTLNFHKDFTFLSIIFVNTRTNVKKINKHKQIKEIDNNKTK